MEPGGTTNSQSIDRDSNRSNNNNNLPDRHPIPDFIVHDVPASGLGGLGSSRSSSFHHHQSTGSLLDSMERRTQRTYRYGIGLVCIGATLNWLGFAQGHGYVDPLRYLGVTCVIAGSFCVCMAMCRWLGRPISSVASHRFQDDELNRPNADVQVINISVPMYLPHSRLPGSANSNLSDEYRPCKPPDYDIVTGSSEPPPYDEAIKLNPSALLGQQQEFTTVCQVTNSNSPSGEPPPYSCPEPSNENPEPSTSTNFKRPTTLTVLPPSIRQIQTSQSLCDLSKLNTDPSRDNNNSP